MVKAAEEPDGSPQVTLKASVVRFSGNGYLSATILVKFSSARHRPGRFLVDPGAEDRPFQANFSATLSCCFEILLLLIVEGRLL